LAGWQRAFGLRRIKNRSLFLQAWALAGAVLIRAGTFNLHFDNAFPRHLAMRILTLGLLALVFYSIR
jgi:hypothetical protein